MWDTMFLLFLCGSKSISQRLIQIETLPDIKFYFSFFRFTLISPPMPPATKYKDFWFKIIGCLLASYIIDALNREETFFQRLSTKYFYIDLAGGFVIALVLWEMVRFATRYLDKRISWTEQPLKRILLQLGLGVVLPSLFSFVFTMLWMRLAYKQ